MTKITTILISISLLLVLTGCISINKSDSYIKETNMEVIETITTKNDSFVYSSPDSNSKLDEEIKADESLDIYQKIEEDDIIWYQIGKDRWIKQDKIISFENMSHEELLNLLDGKYISFITTGFAPWLGNTGIAYEKMILKIDRNDQYMKISPVKQGQKNVLLNNEVVEFEPMTEEMNKTWWFSDYDRINFYNLETEHIEGFTNDVSNYIIVSFNKDISSNNINFQVTYDYETADMLYTGMYKGEAFDTYEEALNSNIEKSVDDDFIKQYGAIGYVEVNVDNLNIRFEHSTRSQKIGTANKGELFIVFDKVNDEGYTWYKVSGYDGCWIADDGTWLTFTPKQ